MNHETSKIYFLNKDSTILATTVGDFPTSETYKMNVEKNKTK